MGKLFGNFIIYNRKKFGAGESIALVNNIWKFRV